MGHEAANPWKRKSYAELSRGLAPSPQIVQAVEFVREKHDALDLGAGSLRHARYLLEQGFRVDAVDRDPITKEVGVELNDNNLEVHLKTFAEFDFADDKYDLVVAKNSLPFVTPEEFPVLWERLSNSVKTGGVFAGTFFGMRDTWTTTYPRMTFLTQEQVKNLLEKFETLSFNEREEDATDIQGNPKHWHLYEVIARKN